VERSLSVRVRVANTLLAVILVLAGEIAAAERTVVLVAARDAAMEEISLLDIRKAYLGISVTFGGNALRPLRRNDDEQLNQIFLQTVIAMSERSYERRLLSLMLKFGTPRPDEVDGPDEIYRRLAGNPNAIAYMWKREAEQDRRVKVVRLLWQEH
jgi:hypothetical protein